MDYLTKQRETRQNFFFGMTHTTLFGVNAVGAGRCQYDYRLKGPILNRSLSFYCIILITEGKAFFSDETNPRIECSKGDSFFIIPDKYHSYGIIKDQDFEETWIAFTGHLIDQIFMDGRLSKENTYYPSSNNQDVIDLFQQAFDYGSSQEIIKQRQLPAIFLQILTHYMNFNQASNTPVWLQKATDYIKTNAKGTIDMHKMAYNYNISYSSFRTLFKKHLGISPGLFHLKQKLNSAGEFLMKGHSVNETSHYIGIEDVYYFSRIFKKHMGCPPSDYIKTKQVI